MRSSTAAKSPAKPAGRSAFSTIGVNPRSNLRLGLSGAAIVVCIAILIWLLSGGDSKEQVASGPPAITDTKTASESPDAGISDDKMGGKTAAPQVARQVAHRRADRPASVRRQSPPIPAANASKSIRGLMSARSLSLVCLLSYSTAFAQTKTIRRKSVRGSSHDRWPRKRPSRSSDATMARTNASRSGVHALRHREDSILTWRVRSTKGRSCRQCDRISSFAQSAARRPAAGTDRRRDGGHRNGCKKTWRTFVFARAHLHRASTTKYRRPKAASTPGRARTHRLCPHDIEQPKSRRGEHGR